MNRAQIHLSIRLCLLAGVALPLEIEIPLCVSVACIALVAFSFWLDSVRRLPPHSALMPTAQITNAQGASSPASWNERSRYHPHPAAASAGMP